MSSVRKANMRRAEVLIDSLESRRLYAAHAIWTINGTSGNDTILVQPNPAHPAYIDATLNGVLLRTRPAASIKSIHINAGDGDDSITINLDSHDHIAIFAHGDAGNDTLLGSAEKDHLFGDAGDDSLNGRGGADTLVGGTGADDLSAGKDNVPDLLVTDSLDHLTRRQHTDHIRIDTTPQPSTIFLLDDPNYVPNPFPVGIIPIDLPITIPVYSPPVDYHRDVPTTDAASSINAFGYDLYNELRTEQPDANLFFSPYSISTALAMVYAGADGETRQQMADVLHLPLDQTTFLNEFANEQSATPAPGSTADVSVANDVWLQQGFNALSSYISDLTSTFNASPHTLDFVNDPADALQQINGKVSDATHGRIPNLLSPDAINNSTRMVLTNAVYFKSDWAVPFLAIPDGGLNSFHSTPSQLNPAQFMKEESTVNYTETSSLQLVEIPYADGQYSMTIVLPKLGQDLSSISDSLTPDALNLLLSVAAPTDTIVTLPEFHLSESYQLTSMLSAMGMSDLFDPTQSNLSGIDGQNDLSVNTVVHKTFLDVTPTGTEAAGATGIGVVIDGVFGPPPTPPQVVTADHPFYFTIRNTQTGATLFSGTLINPDAS
ncbi:MAG TPA: serpin family protein [Tepidisphaeraceae bacterium]|jgi:serpin B|nr:serpin family protein [Tepidisphaeraceae bacterium]